MLPLTKKELKSQQYATEYYIYRKKIIKKFTKDKNYRKVRNHCHYTSKDRSVANSICK